MNAARHLQFPKAEGTQLFDVDNFLSELERQSREQAPPDQFYPQLLEASSLALEAICSAYWTGPPGQLRPLYLHHAKVSKEQDLRALSQELIQASSSGGHHVLPENLLHGPLLVCSVLSATGVAGLLTFELTPGTLPGSAAQLLELTAAIAEIAGEYEQRRQVVAAGVAMRRQAGLEAFLLRIHNSFQVEGIARELAEEGRRLLECDRLAVLTRSGRSWRVVAVSGVDSPSPRAAAVRSIERMVNVVAATGEPFILGDGPSELPPQVQQAVDDYFDGASPRQFIVAPCISPVSETDRTPLPACATIVVEQFQGALPLESLATLNTITSHAAAAISRAEAVRRIPFACWLLGSRRSASRNSGASRVLLWGALLAAICAVMAALLLMPARLEIASEGRFAPTTRMRAFAPRDAIVKQVLVKHGDKVNLGQPLIELRSPELELQIEQIEGQLATTRKEIAALETARLQATLPNQKSETDVGSVVAKLTALRELTTSYERQLELLAKEAARLMVVSPIAGEVLSWKPEDYLQNRPVRRGQRLLEIGATSGDWEIELEVPDRRAGHVLAAAKSNQPLQVSYLVKSDPAQSHTGEVKGIAAATQPDTEGNPMLLVEVRPELHSISPRSGMMVAAKIHCGERSLGYVWFHEAWEALQRHWF